MDFFLGVIVGIFGTLTISKLIHFIIIKRQEKKERELIKNEITNEIIKDEQDQIWKKFSLNTEINLNILIETVVETVKKIASLYHKDSKNPELEASIEELLLANIELSNKLLDTLDKNPFNLLKRVKLSHIYFTKAKYDFFKDTDLYKRIEKYKLWQNWKKIWGTINVANPKYWIAKGGINFSREFLIRLFRSYFIGVVGEEADKLYGGRLKIERKNKSRNEKTEDEY